MICCQHFQKARFYLFIYFPNLTSLEKIGKSDHAGPTFLPSHFWLELSSRYPFWTGHVCTFILPWPYPVCFPLDISKLCCGWGQLAQGTAGMSPCCEFVLPSNSASSFPSSHYFPHSFIIIKFDLKLFVLKNKPG